MSSKILVTGATGKIGKEVVGRLASKNIPVRAFVRSAEKAASIKSPQVELCVGDFSHQESMRAALQGIEKAFLLTPIHADMQEWKKAFIRAALDAGVHHIVLLSGSGATLDSPYSLIRKNAQSEVDLMNSGLEYTILKPHYFMQNMLAFAPSIREMGSFYYTNGEEKMGMVDCRDIAAVAVAALLEDGHEGKNYDISGAQILTMQDAARILTKCLGKDVRLVEISPEQMGAGMAAAGVPEWMVKEMVAAASDKSVKEVTLSSAVRDVTGKQPISLEQFVRDHSSYFK